MWRGDGLRSSQIGDGARREVRPLHRRAQEWLRRWLDPAICARLCWPISPLQVTRGALASVTTPGAHTRRHMDGAHMRTKGSRPLLKKELNAGLRTAQADGR
jgi:hypothetical protein